MMAWSRDNLTGLQGWKKRGAPLFTTEFLQEVHLFVVERTKEVGFMATKEGQ